MATYAIGDVQGCYASLQRLLEAINFSPSQDRLWFVGDLINRGGDSLQVLRFVKNLGPSAIAVLGNHDLHLLAIHTGCASLHKKDTLQPILDAPDRDDLIEWLRHQPLLHREKNFLMVHAGLLPQWSIPQAQTRAEEVASALQSKDFFELMPSIYRCKINHWQEGLPTPERLGVITNALTRMRVCNKEGKMDLSFKGPPSLAPEGFFPWFEVPPSQPRQDTLIFGHWSALGLSVTDQYVALDGGCVWGRSLAAFCLENKKIYKVSCSP